MRIRLSAIVSIVVTAGVIGLALGGCAPPVAPDPSPPMPVTDHVGFAGDLANLLLPHPVSTMDLTGDATVSLEALVAEYRPTDVTGALARLKQYGYQRFASTAWRDEKTDVEASAFLIEFGDPMGAVAWSVDVQRGLTVRPDLATAAAFEVIDEGQWFSWVTSGGYSSVSGVFAKKTIAAWVSLRTPARNAAWADLGNLCEAQYRRLP